MPSEYCLDLADDSDPVYLDVDPSEYRKGLPARRSSSVQTLDGGRVIQDFGVATADQDITCRTEWVSSSTLSALREKYELVATPLKWTDLEASYLVFFREMKETPIRGQDAYEVEMVFAVLQAL